MASTDHLPLRLAHHHSALHHLLIPFLGPFPLKTQFILLLVTQLVWSILEISANSFPPSNQTRPHPLMASYIASMHIHFKNGEPLSFVLVKHKTPGEVIQV